MPDTDKQSQSWVARTRFYLNSKEAALARCEGLSLSWQFLCFALVLIALFSRSPTLLTHAQFYAEDGAVWFAQAYNFGWLHSLTLPQAGYFNTMPRLGAGLALLFPLKSAPLVMAITGMLIQALPVPILLSARCHNWATLPMRIVLAAIYVAIPNAREIHIVATNTQWHLALAAPLIAFASSPQSWRGRLFDCVLLLVAVFTGPFCIVLAPMILAFWWFRRQPWSLWLFGLVSSGALIQILVLLHSTPRNQMALGARPEPFLRMLGGNIFACAIIGSHSFSATSMVFIAAASLGGVAICLYCLRYANLEWKLFLIYCAALYAASLHSPLILGPKPAWDLLVDAPSARYWFFPMLAFVYSAVWCALYGRNRLFKIAGTCIFLFMSIGIVRDWRYGGYPDDHFDMYVERLQAAKPGERVVIPVAPDGWYIRLVKKNQI